MTNRNPRSSSPPKLAVGISWMFALATATAGAAESEDDRIRRVLAPLLQAKDRQMQQLEERVRELEQLTHRQKTVIDRLQAEKSPEPPPAQTASAAPPAVPASDRPTPESGAAKAPEKAAEPSPLAKLILPARKKDEKAGEDEDKGPQVGGFFDVTAQTKTGSTQTFNLGVVELDLDRIVESEHFAASAALDWFPYGTSPEVQIGVAFVDFHLYDASVPVRGRIFQEPGFHFQAGKFDLPFAADYQFFASKDRLTVTPPVTTTRLQGSGINPSNGGYNSTGVRTYGNWNNLSYALYWTDSVFDSGTTVGGRIGAFLNNPYRVHRRKDLPIVDGGLSVLFDLDTHEQTRNQVYAADLSFNYGPFRLWSEILWRQAHEAQVADDGGYYGKPEEFAYHVTFSTSLEQWLHKDIYLYGRYQEWNPDYRYLVSGDDGIAYRVRNIPAVAVGLGYHLNEYLALKLEYTDTLGHATEEPDFQKRMGIAQLVAKF